PAMPGSIGAVALALGTFQLPVLFGARAADPFVVAGLAIPAPFVWGSLVVVALTTINHLGIVISGRTQMALPTTPMVVLFVAALVVLARGGVAPHDAPPASREGASIAAAYLPVFFAY